MLSIIEHGPSLGKARRHVSVVQALELARQGKDCIKDEIWHELAQVQYMHWQHDSAAQLRAQRALQDRMHCLLQQQHEDLRAAQARFRKVYSGCI